MSTSPESSGSSGHGRSEKPSFKRTCSLLSRYVKEKGGLGDLNFGITFDIGSNWTSSLAPSRPVTTMDLFPQHPSFPQEEHDPKTSGLGAANAEAPKTSPLTIIYSGQVMVCNDVPAGKAEEIMRLAREGSTTTQISSAPSLVKNHSEPVISLPPVSNMITPSFGNGLGQEHTRASPAPTIPCELPIMRNASLHRFLMKRKDRLATRAPYQASHHAPSPAPSKQTQNKSRLDLAPQSPHH